MKYLKGEVTKNKRGWLNRGKKENRKFSEMEVNDVKVLKTSSDSFKNRIEDDVGQSHVKIFFFKINNLIQVWYNKEKRSRAMKLEILNFFENLEDTRKNKGKMYKLNDVIIMSIFAILSGCKDATEIEYFLDLRQEYFTQLLDLKHGTPSHDTISHIFRIIKPDKFIELFIEWVQEIVVQKNIGDIRTVAIDGKAIKSATDKINNGNVPYIVSAFATDLKISIGQVKVDDKTNEIKAVPKLLDLIDIKGCVVTMDAMGTQKEIVKKIVKEKKGHYCLALKKNQGTLHWDVDEYFKFALEDKKTRKKLKAAKNFNKEHGRIEERKCYVSNDVEFIQDLKDWKNLKSIIMVENYRETGDDETRVKRYYISDLELSAEEFLKIIREHWEIENSLHWVLDVHFREDLSLSKKDNVIINFSTVRKFCYNLTKFDEKLEHLTVKRRLANYQYDIKNIENLVISLFNCPLTTEK